MKTTVIAHNKNWLSNNEKPYIEIISGKIHSEEELQKFIDTVKEIELASMLTPRKRSDHVQKINA